MNLPTPQVVPAAPSIQPESMLVGPGTAVAVPYFGTRDAEAEPSSNPLSTVIHAVRRRWLAITVLGTLAACCGAAAAWYLVETRFTAVVRLIIPAGSESVLFAQSRDAVEFDLRKRSQGQIITGYKVLEQTLVRLGAAQLPEFRDLPQDSWLPYLKSCVSVTFPQQAEIMELQVRSRDKRTAELLATTITAVYLDEQGEELRSRNVLIQNLKAKHEDYVQMYREQKDGLAKLQELANPAPPPQTPEEQSYLRKLQSHVQMLQSLEQSKVQIELQLERLKRASEPGALPPVSDAEVAELADADPQIKTLRSSIQKLETYAGKIGDLYSGEAYKKEVAKNERAREVAAQRIIDRTAEIRREREKQKAAQLYKADPAELRAQLETMDALIKDKEEHPPERPAAVEATRRSGKPGSATIAVAELDLEVLRWKMDQVENQLSRAELAQAENLARGRQVGIRQLDDKVYMLDDEDLRRRIKQSSAAGGAAFVAVAALIILLDIRRRRLNDAVDVSDLLQIRVLGTVPLLRGKGQKRLEQSARLAEAVDGVAATLLCRTAGDDHRVVMISSAMAGEGKTTLAANLATSLASAGRRTLLVDFDLRRPMLHQVYQVPIGPGLGELLSGPDLTDYVNYVQETTTECLWLIPAGAKRQRAIAELSDARTADLFAALKEQFEFIIVDGPPVLPVVDTRLVARHADGVVLSLLRDVSELPKVRSACQLLQSYRVRILGGVVIGASGDVYYGEPPERVSSIA